MNPIDKRREYAARQAVYYRNYRRARDRAFVRLAQAYPDHYKELFEEERARDEANGKTWLDITGATTNDFDISIPTHGEDLSPGPEKTHRNQQDQSNVGGEE
jgi:hypothetical protein